MYYGTTYSTIAADSVDSISHDATSVTFTVTLTRDLETTTYEADIRLVDKVPPTGDIDISYIDPSRANQTETVSNPASQVTFTNSTDTRGTIVVSASSVNSVYVPIAYYVDTVPDSTNFTVQPDGLAGTDGTVTLSTTDLTFTEGTAQLLSSRRGLKKF